MTANSARVWRYVVLITSVILLGGWVAGHKHSVRAWIALAALDAKEYRFNKIDLMQEAPATLGGITPEESAYLRLKLSFEVGSLTNEPEVIFQTGSFDKGARLEMIGRTASLILKNELAFRGALTRTLEAHGTYDLDFEMLDGAFFSATLNRNTAITAYDQLIDVSNIQMGTGFSRGEVHNGILRNVSVTMGHGSARVYNELRFWMPIADMTFLAVAAFGLLVCSTRSNMLAKGVAKLAVLQRNWRIFGGPWKMVSISSSSLDTNDVPGAAEAKGTHFNILNPIWCSAPDRRVAILIGCLGLGDCVAWAFSKLLLPRAIAPALGLDRASLPSRAPLFEGSAPFTDFTEVNTFPHYISNISWAAPPAEQFRIMLKSWMAHEWPTLWEAGVPLVLFSLIGLLLHLYGMFQLSNVTRESSLRCSQRILLLLLLILTLYPIHFALDRGNAALHNTGFVILGAAYFLEREVAAASLSFALAAVSKITPVAFALSFLLTRQWRGIVLTFGLTLACTILPAMVLHGSIGYSIDWMFEGQRTYTEEFAVKPNLGLANSASLFSAIRFAIIWLQTFRATSFAEASTQAIPVIRCLLPIYTLVMAAVGLDLLVQAWRKRISPEILISLLAIYQIMAPHIIADYYLTFLVIPLLIFSYYEQLRSNRVVPILLVLILIPKSYIWMPAVFSPLPYWISWGVLINGIAVTSLYLYIRLGYVQIAGPSAHTTPNQ